MVDTFTDHINSQNKHLKFPNEAEHCGQLPFLDTLVIVNDDGTWKTKIYQKPTHTDQYLNWDSNHHLEHKRSVAHTLLHRAETVVSEAEDVEEEVKQVKRVLTVNGYKKWSFQIHKKKVREEDKQTECPTANNHPVCCASSPSQGCQNTYRGYSNRMPYHPTTNLSTL